MKKLWLGMILLVVGCGRSDPANDRMPPGSWAVTDANGFATDHVPATVGPDPMHPDEYLSIPTLRTVRVLEDSGSMVSEDARDVKVAWSEGGPSRTGFIQRRWLRPTK